MSFKEGDKVTVTASPWPEQLPNGATGTVTEVDPEEGYLLFVDFEEYPFDNISAYTGWPLTSDEVAAIEVAA